MAKSQLPLLTSAMMLTQALLAAPAGIRAKTSLKARNNVLLLGFLAMIGADLAFALIGSVPGLINSRLASHLSYPTMPSLKHTNFASAWCLGLIEALQHPASHQHVMCVIKGAGFAAGMFLGAILVGVHMALTHGVSLAMVSSYIPTTTVPGIGRITGTCWSFTDFVFGEPLFPLQLAFQCVLHISLRCH